MSGVEKSNQEMVQEENIQAQNAESVSQENQEQEQATNNKNEADKEVIRLLKSKKDKVFTDQALYLSTYQTSYLRELSKKIQFFFLIQISTVMFLIVLSLVLAIYTSFTTATVFFAISTLIFIYLEKKDEEILKILMIRLSMLANLKYSKKYYS